MAFNVRRLKDEAQIELKRKVRTFLKGKRLRENVFVKGGCVHYLKARFYRNTLNHSRQMN